MIDKLQTLPWNTTRRVLGWGAVDWYDGPLEGIVAFDHPVEEFRFKVVGWPTLRELERRFAMAWPVPIGTLELSQQDSLAGGNATTVWTDGGPTWKSLGDVPDSATMFFAYLTWHPMRVVAAWTSPEPISLTDEEVKAILLNVPLELWESPSPS